MAVGKKDTDPMSLSEGKRHRITAEGLSIGTAADIGTIFRAAASGEQKEVAWGHIKQKFLNGKPDTMEDAEGADAVKELILFGDKYIVERAVNLLAEGLKAASYHTDFAVNVSWMVLVSADMDTSRIYQPHPFEAVLNMLADTLMHGRGPITDRDANIIARRKAASAFRVAFGYCGDRASEHDRANEIARVLALVAEYGGSSARSIAIETLNEVRGKSGTVDMIIEEWREKARTALIRSINDIKHRTEPSQDS